MRTRSEIKASRSAMRNRIRAGRREERKRRAKDPKQKGSMPNSNTAENGQATSPAPEGRGKKRISVISPRIVNKRIETYEKIEEVRKKLRIVTAASDFALQHGRSSRKTEAAGLAGPIVLDPEMTEDRLHAMAPFLLPPMAIINNMLWAEVMEAAAESCPLRVPKPGEKIPDGIPDIWSLLGSLRKLVVKLENIVNEADYVHL